MYVSVMQVAPYPGAETGAGGRMRDTHATGTGSIMGGGTAGYCTGNLNIEGYVQPYDDPTFGYPGELGLGFGCSSVD
jgi:phosphoribosylformylglycinamidine synthase